jgi:hypothetical protein
VHDAAVGPALFLAENALAVFVGIAAVDDDGERELVGEPKVAAEDGALRLARGVVVVVRPRGSRRVVVEADFADGGNFFLGPGQLADGGVVGVRVVARPVGVEADGGADLRVAVRELDAQAGGLDVLGDAHHADDAGLARPLHHGVAVGVILVEVEVVVAVKQFEWHGLLLNRQRSVIASCISLPAREPA